MKKISYLESTQNLRVEYNFSYIHDCHKAVQLYFSEKFNFPCNQLGAVVFCFFTCMKNQSGTIEWLAVKQRQDQHEVRHV